MSKTVVTVLQELEKNGNAVHIDELDVTLGVNNKLDTSIKMLIILLTTLSSLPLVPDFKVAEFGLTPEQATMVQELNSQLIYAHGITQKYITQQYFILVCIQKMMMETISNLPETDMTYLLNYIKNYNELKTDKRNIQTGGLPNPFMKSLVYLFSIVSLSSPSASATNNQILSYNDDLKSLTRNDNFVKGIVNFDKDNLQNQLDERTSKKSAVMDINTMVATADANTNAKLQTVWGQLSTIWTTTKSGSTQLQEIISDLNEDSYAITRDITETCISLMSTASEQGIFDYNRITDIKTINEVKEQLESIDVELKQKQDETLSSGVDNFLKGFITSLAIPFNADVATPAALLSNSAEDAYKYYIGNPAESEKQKKEIVNEQKSLALQERKSISPSEKIVFKEKLYQNSRLYCLNSYNLKFRLNSTSNALELVGDKIPYNDMISLITVIEENVGLQINKLSVSDEKDDTKFVKLVLESLQERLNVLKSISDYLSNIIGESKTTINTMSEMNTKGNPLNKFDSFFKGKLDTFRTLSTELKSKYPLTDRKNKDIKEYLENEKQMMETQHNITNTENMQYWKNKVAPFLGSLDIMEHFIETATEKVTGIALAVPKAALKESINTMVELIQETVPSSVLYGIGAFMCLSIMSIAGQIMIFKRSGEIFLTVVTFPFVCVYKLIKTSSGFVCKQIGSLLIGSSNSTGQVGLLTNTANNEADNVEENNNRKTLRNPKQYKRRPTTTALQLAVGKRRQQIVGNEDVNNDSDNEWHGGKRRKYTRKHKLNKTKKARHGKRRLTHYKKRRPTKRH
jgi:hypothetical protein